MNRQFSSTGSVFKTVSHAIFDLDGLLLDTEIIYTQAIQNIIEPYGKTFTWEMKTQLMGLTGHEAARIVVDFYELPISNSELIYRRAIAEIARRHGKEYTHDVELKLLGTHERDTSQIAVTEMKLPVSVDEFLREFRRVSSMNLSSVRLLPGAEKLIRHLHSSKIPIAVATSSNKDSVAIKTQNHSELFSLFHHIVCGGSDPEVKRGKPHPDIFLICAGRFPDKPKPEKCLVFEDAPNGITAARRAGMQCVMVPDERVHPKLTKEATVVLRSLEELKLEDFGLPPLK